MPVKMIAFDMDGTLLHDDHVTIPEKNIAALRAARAKGIKIVAATGRTWCLIENAVEPLGGVDYAVTSNGAAVLEPASHRWIYAKPIPNDKSLELIAFLKRWDVPFEIYCEGQNYMEHRCVSLLPETVVRELFTDYYDRYTTFVDSLEEALGERSMEKIDIFYVPPEHRAEISKGIQAICPSQLSHAEAENMEVTSVGVTKGTALEGLCRELGISAEEVMAFGDGNNDMEMLAWAGLSFAMANGAEGVKTVAKYLAPANYLGGLGDMVQKYVLNQP